MKEPAWLLGFITCVADEADSRPKLGSGNITAHFPKVEETDDEIHNRLGQSDIIKRIRLSRNPSD